ncbi:MAG: hypothetical protein JXQ73_32040 [Phycisphaerae bacterium]|nr:hypothetical protein [Phycisphaerae bacterium]
MELAAATSSKFPDLLVLVAVVIMVMLAVISARRRSMNRGASPRAYAREQLAKLREQNEVRDDLQELMMQLEQLARELSAQVDTRFAKLEKAITDADARIAELKRLGCVTEDGEPDGRGAETEEAPDGEIAEPVDEAAGRGEPETAGADPASAEAGDSQQGAVERRVIALAGEGKTALEIAREVGRDVGEIELIIKLKRKDGYS